MGAVTGFAGIGSRGSGFTADKANVINPLEQLVGSNAAATDATSLATHTAGQVAGNTDLGLARQNQVYQQMQQLGAQLNAQSQGQGPNPALAQLANTTGQNVAATTAAMAGARGAAANPGLIAREAAQQGATTEQNAVGQAAVMRANQQLAAQQALQAQQNSLAALGTTQVNQGVNAANVGAGAAQAQQNALASQLAAYNTANVQNASQANSANAGVQGQAAKGFGDTSAAFAGSMGSMGGGMAAGGIVDAPSSEPTSTASRFARGLGSTAARYAKGGPVDMKVGGKVPGRAKVPGPVDSYANDTVKAQLSPEEIVLPRSVTKSADPVGESAKFVAAVLAKRGSRR